MSEPVTHTVEIKCVGDPDKIMGAVRAGLQAIGYHADTVKLSAQKIPLPEEAEKDGADSVAKDSSESPGDGS
jgi:hypothetical protein